MTPEAVYAIRQMRRCAKQADKSRDLAFAARDRAQETALDEISRGKRKITLGTAQSVAEQMGYQDLDFKANVSDNQWYIQQAIMWASVAEVELDIARECDESTLTRLRDVNPPRTQ